MKKFLILPLFIFLIMSSDGIKAQDDPVKGIIDMVGKQAGMNDLLGQFVNGIKPSAFSSGKSGKNDILNMLSGINASDYMQYASLAGTLAGALKGTSFLPDWASKKDGILDQITKAASIADVANGVLGFSNMIDPKNFSKSFKKKKGSWDSALNVLSMVK